MGILVALLIIAGLIVVGMLAGAALNLLWFILVGLVIGALARLVIKGTGGLGVLATMLYGIAGALLGGVIANALDVGDVLQFIISVAVAAALIAVTSGRERSVD